MNHKEYPKTFYRGIPNKDFVSDGYVISDAFQFEDFNREDGYKELSINWNDDGEALELLLTQKKDNGKYQFGGGVAQLDLDYVKMILAPFYDKKEFQYERREIPGNVYHGNLLMKKEIKKPVRSLIMNGLALAAGNNIYKQT